LLNELRYVFTKLLVSATFLFRENRWRRFRSAIAKVRCRNCRILCRRIMTSVSTIGL